MSSGSSFLRIARWLGLLGLLAVVAFPLVGVVVAAAGVVLARRGTAWRPLGIVLVVAGLLGAALSFLVLYGTGSAGPLRGLP
jgi:hypothetical protein